MTAPVHESQRTGTNPASEPGMPAKQPPELTDRQIYNTRIGPVCMSKVEHEAYLEALDRQEKGSSSL